MTQITKRLRWNEAARQYEWTGPVTGLVKAVGFGDARLGFVLDKASGARIAMNLSGSDDPQATDPFYIESPNQENIYDASNMREAIKILTNIRKGKRDPDLNPTGGIGMKNPSIVDAIRPGDKVTIVNRFGQKSTGRAVMRSSYGGWVLNMGGRYGTPGLADADNIVKVVPSKKPTTFGMSRLMHNPTGKNFLAFTHAGTQYKVSIRPETMGHVVQYGSHKFPLPHPSWKIIGFSTHHWHRSPTISIEQAAKDPSIIKGAYVWDIDHGTTRTWGGQHYGKLPKVQSASLMNPVKMPVMFRRWPNGDIIALFPTEPGTMDPYTCSSYEHVGQHGAADPHGVIQRTKPAKPGEYADLMKELRRIGYRNLVVYDRYQRGWLEIIRQSLRRHQ